MSDGLRPFCVSLITVFIQALISTFSEKDALSALGDVDTLSLEEIIESKIETAARMVETSASHLLLDGGPLSKYNPKDYTVFSISTQNYNTFYNQKNIEAYKKFYEYYYRKEK